ncbi:MAG TPA: hypothetical protein VNW68_03435 [Candidatus Limnocylindria bacterium]|jgi:hypothetical protein|nr:hypothetical protein [Candidatus Limnocylindria bacterium]
MLPLIGIDYEIRQAEHRLQLASASRPAGNVDELASPPLRVRVGGALISLGWALVADWREPRTRRPVRPASALR